MSSRLCRDPAMDETDSRRRHERLLGNRPKRLGDLLDRAKADDLGGPRRSGAVVHCASRLHTDGVSPDAPVHAFFVPGRIEVLGKHTDYAGGRSLLAAVDRGICVLAVPRRDDQIVITDVVRSQRIWFRLDPELQPQGGWRSYPMIVARRVAANFPGQLRGADLAFASNLPPAAGMSSSSALVTAVFLGLAAVNALGSTDRYRGAIGSTEELAEYLGAVENGLDYRTLSGRLGVGTRGGSEDHTAILCGRTGELVQYAFRPVRFERAVPLPAGHVFAIGASGVVAEKTGSARERYNRAADQMRVAVELWCAESGSEHTSVGAILDTEPAATDRLCAVLGNARHPQFASAALVARVRQFVEESGELIPDSVDALARHDLARFGELVDRSQELAIRALGNQVEETIELARSARALGAAAASAFGAGFGGSVWALVPENTADRFLSVWRRRYLDRFPGRARAAEFFTTAAAPPARPIA